MPWFKQKMTIDYCASMFAEAIRENIGVYQRCLRNHAGGNLTEDQIEALGLELWAFDLAILDFALALADAKVFASGIGRKLIPMIVVGYMPIAADRREQFYLDRSHYYGRAVDQSGAYGKILHNMVKAFLAEAEINWRQTEIDINPGALEAMFASASLGSLEGLLGLGSDVAKNFRLI